MAKAIEITDAEKAEALAEYQNRALTTEDIATKYGVSLATITVWAKRAGLPLRKQGRRMQQVPTARQAEILRLVKVYTYAQVGSQLGMHKQSIQRIVKRWHDRQLPVRPPFEPGDRIVWNRKKFTVVDAEVHTGTLIDDRGKYYPSFKWNAGKAPKKFGVNPQYVVGAAVPA